MPSSQWAVMALGLSILIAYPEQSMAESSVYDPGRVEWSALEFRASKFKVTATSEVEIHIESASRAASQWQQTPTGRPVMPAGSKVIRVELGSVVFGKTSNLDLWLDPGTGAAMQRSQLETGRKVRHNRYRSLRFADTGVFHSTYRATEETVDRSYEEWTLTEVFETYPESLGRGIVVTEPSALFYLLAVADLDRPGDRITTYVFSKDLVMQVHLAVEERTEIKVDYTEATSAGQREVNGRRRVLRIRLDGRPVGDGGHEKDFEFLGLRGDVDVYLDPDRRIPLQISGDIKYVGKGHVRLQRVRLN